MTGTRPHQLTPNHDVNLGAKQLRCLVPVALCALAPGLRRALGVTNEAGVELNHRGVLRIEEVTG